MEGEVVVVVIIFFSRKLRRYVFEVKRENTGLSFKFVFSIVFLGNF